MVKTWRFIMNGEILVRKIVTVKDVTIGEGMPKICVPLMEETVAELKETATFLSNVDLDIVEWRVDFFKDVDDLEKVKEAAVVIRNVLVDIPILFTFRSKKEGGEREVSVEFYVLLNKAVAETGAVDIIDVELFTGEAHVKDIIATAHTNNVYVVISNHDFEKTPTKEEIVSRLCKMQQLNGDLVKMAVMPNSPADVLTLLAATNMMNENYATRPLITMSMAGKGVISRLAGEIFGSAVTFGATKKASAPGQIDVGELRNTLLLLHNQLSSH